MPFDPKSYLQQSAAPMGFDPKSYLSAEDAKPEVVDVAGPAQAGLEHFGNAVAMGYLPHLQALAEKMTPNPTSDTDAKLAAQGFNVKNGDQSYVQSRDQNIARIAQEGQDHPYASAAGTVGGVLTGGLAMGRAMGGRAATAAGRIYQGAKTGTVMGAVANPGDTEGKIDPIQPGERYDNAKIGAVTGGVVSGAVEAAPHVWNGIKAVGQKVASTLSGLSDDVISRYAARTDEINQMIKQSGGNMTEAADKVRQDAQNAIRSTRAQYSAQIGNALKSAPNDPVADVAPIKDQLNRVLDRLNPNLQSEAVTQIKNTIDKIDTEAAQNGGKVSVQQLNQITDFLQGRARSAYLSGGQIFQNAKEAAQAAKGAAAVSRKMLNGISPEIAEANNKLAMLHSLEDKLNPNLIAPGGPDSALMAAGSGANPRNAKLLGAVGDASGYPILDKAKDISAARAFASPGLIGSDSTGKAVARQLIAGGIGHAIAGPAGYLAAGAASPAAVKVAINAANLFKNTPSLVSFAQKNPELLQRVAQSLTTPPKNSTPTDEPIDAQTIGVFRNNPSLVDSISNQALKSSIQRQMGRRPDQAAGEDKWANQGLGKLGIQDNDMASRLMQDPRAKQLLIQASDLPPGSKAMKRIQDQINQGWGKNK